MFDKWHDQYMEVWKCTNTFGRAVYLGDIGVHVSYISFKNSRNSRSCNPSKLKFSVRGKWDKLNTIRNSVSLN